MHPASTLAARPAYRRHSPERTVLYSIIAEHYPRLAQEIEGSDGHLPKFVRQYAKLADDAVAAVEAFFADVQSGAFPDEDETYHMAEDSAQILLDINPDADHLLADEAMEH